MNIDGIEVSYFCSVYAVFEYVIKHEYVLTDKLACAVTYCPREALAAKQKLLYFDHIY